jgi:heme/copper-type cytochrome/quinol oxidase subunit 1
MLWFQSPNAKEIGTLYLIFSVFAGMVGTAFSVLFLLSLLTTAVLTFKYYMVIFLMLFLFFFLLTFTKTMVH